MTTSYNDVKDARTLVKQAQQNLNNEITTFFSLEKSIKQAQNSGLPIDPTLLANYNLSKDNVFNLNTTLTNYRSNLQGTIYSYLDPVGMYPIDPETVWYTDSRYPMALLPIRIETRFIDTNGQYGNGGQGPSHLWLRIYPDDIWIQSHCKEITNEECIAASAYIGSNQTESDWETLCKAMTPTRAAYVVKETSNNSIVPNSTTYNFTKDSNIQPSADLLPETFRVYIYWRVIGSNTDYNYGSSVDIYPTGARPDVNTGIDLDFSVKTTAPTTPPISPIERDPLTGELKFNDPSLKWIYDFDVAEAMGLAKKIDLSPYHYGIDTEFKLIVIGVKNTLDIDDSTQALKDLFNNHRFTEGLALLKQGQPTKNANAGYATFNIDEDIIRAAEFRGAGAGTLSDPLYQLQTVEKLKSDGQLLAEALGFEGDFFDRVYNSELTDVNTLSGFNNILWEATGGSYLKDQRLGMNRSIVLKSRAYVEKYVTTRGRLPSFRIGETPYGVIPAGNVDGLEAPFRFDEQEIAYLLKTELDKIEPMYWSVAREMRKAGGGDGDNELAEIIGKHAVPQEIYERIGFGAGTIWNNYMLNQSINEAAQWISDKKAEALDYMNELKITGPIPPLLQTSYLEAHQLVSKPLCVEYPSEEPIPAGALGVNYLQWLAQATVNDLLNSNTIFQSNGYPEPDTVLFKLMKNALLKEYWNIAADLLNYEDSNRRIAEIWDVFPLEGENTDVQTGNLDGDYSDFKTIIGENPAAIFDKLYTAPSGYQYSIKDFLDSAESQELPSVITVNGLRTELGTISTKSSRDIDLMSRELLALYSYRYDSWHLSIINWHLHNIRTNNDTKEKIHIGAYGWVSDLKPRDPASPNNNQGLILGATQAHAGAGALIKSAHSASTTPNDPTEAHHITLTSERARKALQYLEGVNNGQVLSVLLGYDIEKEINNYHKKINPNGTVNPNLNKFIVPLRNAFPHNFVEGVPTGAAVESIAPRNVVNGKDLLEVFRDPQNTSPTYTFFFSKLTVTYTDAERSGLVNVLNKASGIADGLADLTETEAAYQMILGNLERAGAFAEAVSGSKNTPTPQVLDTPSSGTTITNKVTMHFDSSITTAKKWKDGPSGRVSARAKTEPAIEDWIQTILPAPDNILFKIQVRKPDDTVAISYTNFDVSKLSISAYDFIYLLNDDYKSANSALKQRIRYCFGLEHQDEIPEDSTFEFDFEGTGGTSINQVYYLCKLAKQIITKCRPLRSSDYFSPELPVQSNDEVPSFDKSAFAEVLTELKKQLNILEPESIIKKLSTFEATSYPITVSSEFKNNILSTGLNGTIQTGPDIPIWKTIEGNIGDILVQRTALLFNGSPAPKVTLNHSPFTLATMQATGFKFSVDAIITCQPNSGANSTILSFSFNNNNQSYLIVGINNEGNAFCELNKKRFTYVNTNINLRDGNPHHIFVSKTETTVEFMLDTFYKGYFEMDSVQVVSTPSNIPSDNLSHIGWSSLYQASSGFGGKISCLRVWNDAISFDSEKATLGFPVLKDATLTPKLICDWKMDDVVTHSSFIKFYSDIIEAADYNLKELLANPISSVKHKAYFQIRDLAAQGNQLLVDRYAKLKPIANTQNEEELLANAKHNIDLILGADMKILPRFKFRDTTPNNAIYKERQNIERQLALPVQQFLLKTGTSASGSDVQNKIDLWLQGVSRVCANTNSLKQLDDLWFAFTGYLTAPLNMRALQLPYPEIPTASDLWAAYDFSDNASEEELKKMYGASKLCIAAHIPATMEAASIHCGLLIDEWTETIPHKEIEGGVAFHYDKPFAKPPQAIILALPPYKNSTACWQRNVLQELVHDTLNLSIMRSVDYEDLAPKKLATVGLSISLPFTPGGTFSL